MASDFGLANKSGTGGDRGFRPLLELADRIREDPAVQARINSGESSACLAELGFDLPAGVRARVVANTPGRQHFVLPPDPNAALQDESLGSVAGGSCAGSAGTAGSFGCLLSCAFSLGTVGTASTAGSDG